MLALGQISKTKTNSKVSLAKTKTKIIAYLIASDSVSWPWNVMN